MSLKNITVVDGCGNCPSNTPIRSRCKLCLAAYSRQCKARSGRTQKTHGPQYRFRAPEGFKFCTKCSKTLPATTEFFHRCKTMRGGLVSRCKSCVCKLVTAHKIARGGKTRTPMPQRFWEKADIRSPSECWEWRAARLGKFGYGAFCSKPAHRVAWTIVNGAIPRGLWVLHKCDNPPCVNPGHLFLGTHQDNMNDMIAKGRDRKRPLVGAEHANAKLTERQVVEIRKRYANGGVTHLALAAEYGVSKATIAHIIRRILWRHVA